MLYGLCGFGADCSDCGARYDNDGDGYYDDEGVGLFSPTLEMDCDDNDANINPSMLDIGQDGIDQTVMQWINPDFVMILVLMLVMVTVMTVVQMQTIKYVVLEQTVQIVALDWIMMVMDSMTMRGSLDTSLTLD